MYKKYILLTLFLSVLLIAPNFSLADTNADVQAKIQSIMVQIKALQDQLARLQSQRGDAVQKWCHTFNSNLKIGDNGSEVYALQTALIKDGTDSIGVDSDEVQNQAFGEVTAAAVTGFQEKYRDEILTPVGLKYGTGYVGKSTRAKLNQLYGCGGQKNGNPFTASPTSGPAPLTVNFSGPGDQFSYSIDFGDGQTVNPVSVSYGCPAANPSVNVNTNCRLFSSHTYTTAGTYTATLTKQWQCPTGQTECPAPLAPGTVGVVTITVQPSAPTISQLSPSSGPTSTQVTITGTGFTATNNIVYFDRASISNLNSSNGTSLTFTVPSGAPGGCGPTPTSPCWSPTVFQPGVFYKVYVSNANGNSNSANFFVSQSGQTVPSIQITSPAGGEQWTSGTTHTITWTSSNVSSVNISYSGCALPPPPLPTPLIQSNASPASPGSGSGVSTSTTQVAYPCVVGPVASNIPAQNGSYSWTIPTDLPSSISSYQLIISDAGASQLSVTSNQFSITSLPPKPTIAVLSPNWGDKFTVGQTISIRWRTNISNAASEISLVNDPTGDTVKYISLLPPGITSTTWTITSDIKPGTYRIRVHSYSVSSGASITASGDSDVLITIAVATSTSSITVLSPNGGEVWTRGSTHTINWLMPSGKFSSILVHLRSTDGTKAYTVGSFGGDISAYGWAVGQVTDSVVPPDGQYTLRVSGLDSTGHVITYGESNAPFTITQATVSSDKLLVSLDSATPIVANIPAGSTGQVIGAFKFSAPAQSQITISQVTLIDYVNSSPAVSADLKNFSLWDGGTQIGQTVPATVIPPSGITPGSMNFYNLSWVVPAGSSKVLSVKADVSSTAAGNRHAIQLGGFGYAEPNISNNWASNGPFTAPSFNIMPASACPSTYSAAVTLVPSTIAPNATGTAKIVLSGSNPGGFAITLSGAATGQTNTLTWNNYNGNSCSAYYEVPFTAGQTSGAVNASLNFVGAVGSANLTVTSSATGNVESSALIASMAAMLNQMQKILKNMAR